MAITRPQNRNAHPGYVDLPGKRGLEESEEDVDQLEPDDLDLSSPKPRKAKRRKHTPEEKQRHCTLAELQDRLLKAAAKVSGEAVRLPGPQMTKMPWKLSTDAAKKLAERRGHPSKYRFYLVISWDY